MLIKKILPVLLVVAGCKGSSSGPSSLPDRGSLFLNTCYERYDEGNKSYDLWVNVTVPQGYVAVVFNTTRGDNAYITTIPSSGDWRIDTVPSTSAYTYRYCLEWTQESNNTTIDMHGAVECCSYTIRVR